MSNPSSPRVAAPHPRSTPAFPVDLEGYGVLPYMDVSTLQFQHRPTSPPSRLALLYAALSPFTDPPTSLTPLESLYRHHHSTTHLTRLRCSLIALTATLYWTLPHSTPHSQPLALLASLAVLPSLTLHPDVHSPAFRLPLLLSLLAPYALSTPGWLGYTAIQLALIAGVRPPFPFYLCASALLTLALAAQLTLTSPSTLSLLSLLSPLLLLPSLFFVLLLPPYALETASRVSFWIRSAIAHRPDLLPPLPALSTLLPFLTSAPPRDTEPLPPASSLPHSPDYTPVFISGFHRSGTTFLYDELLRLLPGQVAHLSPYELLMFPYLMRVEGEGRGAEARQALDNLWKAVGVRDRGMDRAKVTATTPPEEYCFVLMGQWGVPLPSLRTLTHRGNGQMFEHLARISGDSHATFHRLCLKLLHTQRPAHRVVLMKNPFEYGNEGEVLRRFPSARFIHIRRAPLEVISSQCATAWYHVAGVGAVGGGLDPYLWMLLLGWPRLGLVGGRLQWVLQRLWAGEAGARVRSMRAVLQRYVGGAVWAKETYARLPEERAWEVRYERLVKEPSEVLEGIVRWMGLEEGLDRGAMQQMRAEKSKSRICDEVRLNQEWILGELRKRDVEYEEKT